MKIKLTLSSFALAVLIIVFVISLAVIAIIDSRVTNKLEGVLWTVPAKVYSRSLDLAEGLSINKSNLLRELKMLSYSEKKNPTKPGEYFYNKNKLNIFLRGYEDQNSGLFEIFIRDGRVEEITNQLGLSVDLVKLEPIAIGGMYPSHMEDRILVSWPQVPSILIDTILSVEDQTFFNHNGISLRSISRAFFTNVKAGDIEQGGSTITQQLAKNLFFSPEQTIKRKVMEAIAALLIEFHYSKEEILLAYINDVFLAQSGKRAVHGFGMGAQHFFGTSLMNLETDQIALLVGMLKGPSLYNPRRNPNNATNRRNLVLRILHRGGHISLSSLEEMKTRPLRVIKPSFRSETRYPAFHDLVRLELRENYQDSELRTQGLRIQTNLDPVLQESLESSIKKTKLELVNKYGNKLNELEGAAIAVDIISGEIKAVVGSSNPSEFGFNRSINAIRPIGSLVKPFIYLTALNKYDKYTLTTILDDSKLSFESGGEIWEPNNFDKKYHGNIPLHVALWQSYNIASARLGMELGYDSVQETFSKLGISKTIERYPSLFIGSFEMSPFDAIQSYQVIAADGFYSPLRSIRDIQDLRGEIDLSYPYKIEQRIRPEPLHLLKFAMKQTFISGTARGYPRKKIESWQAGGKTGTSDDQRDSWFVGFAGDILVLVWLGFDDNRPTPLTGRSGALEVWKNFIDDIQPTAVQGNNFPRIKYVWVDKKDGLLSGEKCKNSLLVPFINGTEPNTIPAVRNRCATKPEKNTSDVMQKLRKVFEEG
jgi:penicillin-binding protein 1B